MTNDQYKWKRFVSQTVPFIKTIWHTQTINSQSIKVLEKDSSWNILRCTWTVTITDWGSWYAKWCIYIDTDITAWTSAIYENVWTTSSCNFDKVSEITTAEIENNAVTNVKISVPKLVTYQQTFAFWSMTDWGSTSWTLALSTSIPEGAVFVQSFIDNVTGFAWDTSAVITIWDWTDVDRYNTGTPNVFATAIHVSAWSPSGTTYHSAAKTPTVTITSASDFTSVSAWQATITLMYYQSV